MHPILKQALSISEFCDVYGICRTQAYAEVNAGRLKIAKLGRRTLIPAAAAQEWLNRLLAETAEGAGK